MRKTVGCHLHKGGNSVTGDESTERGSVYMMKSRGPRTEPLGTPQEEVHKDEKVLLHLTRKERDDKYLSLIHI